MILSVINHSYRYETENVVRIFFPVEKIIITDSLPDASSDYIITERRESDGDVTVCCSVSINGKTAQGEKKVCGGDEELLLAQLIFEILTQITQYTPSWGVLTGVRPSKLMRSLIASSGEADAIAHFKDNLFVSDDKTQLALSVARAEDKIISLSRDNSYSLYVSIPFCPTRCSYCSFVSHSIAQAKKLIPDYVSLLCRELEEIAKIADSLKLNLETVYFGGGTPTSLDEAQLKAVTDAVSNNFDVAKVREYTVEAGRPDTLNAEKLRIMKNAGVSRISINPQTFNPDVLRAIGRNHTPEMTENAFYMAREAGFDNINMDFIASLPTDTYESFCASIDRAISLAPENITVHTLALKRAATIVTGGESGSVQGDTDKMLSYASHELYANGYFPYYMYRQSKSVGNNENVGWCRNDRECLYNIYMMEEVHTVLAAGGGAVTKLKSPFENRIERIFNFKYPYEYINRFDELSQRKNRIAGFYEELGM
ncbi:MAG: coproporphyrinogen dehydrogenase HemZ [Clostridia bacterium]|nr:coproporphyrinogen dehydrogenase HemZ [Clostridia bacterium]